MMLLSSFGVYVAVLLLNLPSAVGHGYLKSPRSRNYVAYKSVWWPLDDSAPWPESDVQSLNTGGTIARCGKVIDRNYDSPKNNKGKALTNTIQASYNEGSFIDLDVVLSVPHGGHFVYKACPISPREVATQACFDIHPLQFVEDNLYGAVGDANYPGRAYLPPDDFNGIKQDTSDVPGKKYSHKYRLPSGLVGANVLIQWHYITANSGCSHEGYTSYAWPPGFENQYQSTLCPPLSASGGSFAEQFWNCAEVEIIPSNTSLSTTTTSTIPAITTTSKSSPSTTVITTVDSTSTTASSRKRAGNSCSLSNECSSNSCFDSKCECRRNADCMDGKICNIAGNGAEAYIFSCMEVYKPVGDYCLLPSQCESGSCYEGICECRASSDCMANEVCDKSGDRFVCTGIRYPTMSPTRRTTVLPTPQPSLQPSVSPQPSGQPSSQPSPQPSSHPSLRPSVTSQPSSQPSPSPSMKPLIQPSVSSQPSSQPSPKPSAKLSSHPSLWPSVTSQPSSQPSPSPSPRPSLKPSFSAQPSIQPSMSPTYTARPTLAPSESPSVSTSPSMVPSEHPSTSTVPSNQPIVSLKPSSPPSVEPSDSSQPSNHPSPSGSYKATVAAYYASWQWYDRNKLAAPSNLDFTKVQRVNYAFFQTTEDGYLYGTDSWADSNLLFGPQNWNPGPHNYVQYCSWDSASSKSCNYHIFEEGLIHLVHAAGAEIYPSIGGWTLSDAFPVMAASATARTRFANQCKELIQDYGFDGIDLDWEYPGYGDHSGTVNDKANFNLLLDEVRAALDDLGEQTSKRYGLTAALPCGPQHMVNIDIPHANSKLDELNVMSYDFGGSWSETTSVNAPMTNQGWGPEDFSVDECVKNWVEQGASREKINLGLSFYGRSFAGATGLDQIHQGADVGNWNADEGTPQYYNILAKLPNMISVRDNQTKSQYAYFPTGGLVSFDDKRSICEKTEYSIINHLNGFLIWELSGDLLQDLSTPLLDSINRKLTDPNLDCETIASSGGSQATSTSATGATAASTTGAITTSTTTTTIPTKTCHSHKQSCGRGKPCPNDKCCSDWGYCGSSIDFCGGPCCQSGPCHKYGGSKKSTRTSATGSATSTVSTKT